MKTTTEQDITDTEDKTDGKFCLPKLSIDWRLYEDYFEESEISDEKKREFIETLWYIIMAFVDLGFGIEPVQLAIQERQKKTSGSAVHALAAAEESLLKDAFTSSTPKANKEGKEKGAQT